jgi:GMC oxidoreductase/FAD binding domain
LITSASGLPDRLTLTADLAVVGAGPAGIVVALEAAHRGFDVVLVESGQEGFDQEAQELADADDWDAGLHPSMQLTTRRQLGGTSVIWGGKCVPYDEIDFDHRPFIGGFHWPVGYQQIQPYFQPACDWLACGRAVFDITQMPHLMPRSLVPGFSDGDVRASTLERWSLPTNFGREYRNRIRQSARVRALTGLTCTRVVCSWDESQVGQLVCRTLDGKQIQICARAYVLACGGLETTRLLLASPGTGGRPLGNHSGHLGSWYMGHIEGVIANVRFSTPPKSTIFGYEHDVDGTYIRRRLTVSREAQHARELPNVAAWLANPELADPRHRNGVLSFCYLALKSPLGHRVAPDAQRLSLGGEDVPGSPYGGAEQGPVGSHLLNVARNPWSVARFAVGFGSGRFLPHRRRVPGFFVYNKQNLYPLQYHGEQVPNQSSRVTLAEACNAVGMPKLRIDIKFSAQDVDGIIRTHQLWDSYLRRSGLGRLEYVSADPGEAVWSRIGGGFHQLGTTRMAARPEDGVVDPDLAVHGIRNLFVASSSAFVTAGQANPTFMIVAFAVRLADRLRKVLPSLPNAEIEDRSYN